MDTFKAFLIIVGIIALVCIAIFVLDQDEKIVKEWVTDHGMTVKSCDICAFDVGPFMWKDKNSIVWCIETNEGKTYWFCRRWGWNMYVFEGIHDDYREVDNF
jgi:hypothetical protein